MNGFEPKINKILKLKVDNVIIMEFFEPNKIIFMIIFLTGILPVI